MTEKKTTAKKAATKKTTAKNADEPLVEQPKAETANAEKTEVAKAKTAKTKADKPKTPKTKAAKPKADEVNQEGKKTRYSDAELEEFKAIIHEKLKLARHDYEAMMRQIMNADGNDVDDTSPTYKALEEGSLSQSKEELMNMAYRQQKFIKGLEAALMRIENKTYGIDRMTGELIPKERLRVVPHATLSVASKNARKK